MAVAVSSKRVAAAVGLDLVCLEDRPTSAKVLWVRRELMTKTYLPVGVSIRDKHVYCCYPGKDGLGLFLRVALDDGSLDKKRDVLDNQWAALAPAAVRGRTA